MGVPRFAAHLKKKWPGIAAKRDRDAGPAGDNGGKKKWSRGGGGGGGQQPGQARVPDKVAALYVDMNGIIHPCCHSEDDPRVAAAPRAEKIRRVLAAVDDLVQRTQPEALLYLAMDGVAPRAKMNQQRSRRYMAAVAKHGTVKDGGFAPEDPAHNSAAPAAAGAAAASATAAPAAAAAAHGDEHALDLGIYAGAATAAAAGKKDESPNKSSSMGDPFMSMSTPDAKAETDQDGERSAKPEGGLPAGDADATALEPLPPPVMSKAKTAEGRGNGGGVDSDNEDDTVYDENQMGGFDSNCISPGTSFMQAMTVALKKFVADKLRSGEWRRDLAVIVSGSDEPGEGEHKLIDFMRRFSTSFGWPRGAHVIHGLDADLILLCLSLHISNVFILRDNDRRVAAPAGAGAPPPGLVVTGAAAAAPGGKKQGKPGKKPGAPKDDDAAGEGGADAEDEESSSEGDDEDEDDDAAGGARGAAMMTRTPSRSPMAGPVIMTPERRKAMAKTGGADAAKHEHHDHLDVAGAAGGHIALAPRPPPVVSPMLSSSAPHDKPAGAPQLSSSQEVFDVYIIAEYIVAEICTIAVSVHGAAVYDQHLVGNGKHLVDDFVFLCSVLGNDFMPRLPSAFAGEAAIDNIVEVYVRNVIGHGFITVPVAGTAAAAAVRCPDINLDALLRFMEGYAEVEVALFRRFAVSVARYVPDDSAVLAAAGAGFAPAVDRVWADRYHRSTTCTKESCRAACEKYLEGMRFVFEYYCKTSESCSWRWFYPFHHAPFAHNLAAHLRDVIASGVPPPAPPVEKEAPSPFVQLLCILPPTSLCLLPRPLRKLMVHPPEALQSSFPHDWQVDLTCAEGQEHLSTVMIPFANLEGIAAEVGKVLASGSAAAADMPEDVRARGTNQRELSCIIVHEDNKNIYRALSMAAALESNSNGAAAATAAAAPPAGPLKVINVMRLRFEGDAAPVRGIISAPFAMPHEGTASAPGARRGGGGGGAPSPANAGAVRHTALGLLSVSGLPTLPAAWAKNAYKEQQHANSKTDGTTAARVLPSAGTHIGQSVLFGAAALGLVAAVLITFGGGSSNGNNSGSIIDGLVFLLRLFALTLPFFWAVVAVCMPNVALTSTTYRNQVRETFNDWLCRHCGGLNFSKEALLCFRCKAPYEERGGSCRVMTGRVPKVPPLLSVDHTPHLVDCVLRVDQKFIAMAE